MLRAACRGAGRCRPRRAGRRRRTGQGRRVLGCRGRGADRRGRSASRGPPTRPGARRCLLRRWALGRRCGRGGFAGRRGGGLGLLGCLHVLLVGAHLGKRGGIDDVGDRAPRVLLAEGPGRLLPALGAHGELLAEQGNEDPGLLLTEAGELLHVAQELRTVGGLPPDGGRIAVIALDEQLAQRLDARRHRGRVAVQRGALGEGRRQLIGIHGGDHRRGEGAPQPLREDQGALEGPLEGDLLVEHHPDQEREWIVGEEAVGVGVAREV